MLIVDCAKRDDILKHSLQLSPCSDIKTEKLRLNVVKGEDGAGAVAGQGRGVDPEHEIWRTAEMFKLLLHFPSTVARHTRELHVTRDTCNKMSRHT